MVPRKRQDDAASPFGSYLEIALATKGWSGSRLAQEMGIPRQAISNAKKRVSDVGPERMIELVRALGADRVTTISLLYEWIVDKRNAKQDRGGRVLKGFANFERKMMRFMDKDAADQMRRLVVESVFPELSLDDFPEGA